MKPQDIIFFIVLFGLLLIKRAKLALALGIACFIMAIPLFTLKIFFTAERLIWYATAFILLSCFIYFWQERKQ